MEDKEEHYIRDELSRYNMRLTKGHSFMFDNIDSYVSLSRENSSVQELEVHPFDSDAGNYEVGDKVGEIVGNLMELRK